MAIDFDNTMLDGARLRVIGVGGGGGNAINNMIYRGLDSVDFIAANTDKQALDHNLATIKIQLGREFTKGLGAGSSPDVGKRAVEESIEDIKNSLKGSDMVFVTCGMGGGTGTGGSPAVAKVAQEVGALVVGIVTKPFTWEGKKRIAVAESGIDELRQYVDALIVIPNQKLLEIIEKNTNFGDAFLKVDEVLYNATRGIADIISQHGVVNVDFADVRTVMKGMGDAIMGIGISTGNNRAAEATQNALNSPLLDGITIAGAQGVLVNITGGCDMTMHEIAEAVTIVEEAAGADVNLIHGVVYKPEPMDEVSVTVVATGFNKSKLNGKKFPADSSLNFKAEELPFNKRMVEQGNPFNTAVASGGITAPHTATETVFVKPAVAEPMHSPRGHEELKRYDVPAYERRMARDDMEVMENSLNQIEKVHHISEGELADANGNGKYHFEKPAFLRKIMD
ncbi:MAG: cell division protein FtsZ [Bacteroidetes bacterium]|nr:MAG: cell division protein FtsZ [Bacteroidota bacterium]